MMEAAAQKTKEPEYFNAPKKKKTERKKEKEIIKLMFFKSKEAKENSRRDQLDFMVLFQNLEKRRRK